VRGASYLRNPLPEVERYLSGPYRVDVTLPADADATGYRRDGRSLWLSSDRRRAFVGTPASVEVWPRAAEVLGCD
jgi:hypothetical protein